MLLYIIKVEAGRIPTPYLTQIIFQDYSIGRIIDSMKAISSEESLYLR